MIPQPFWCTSRRSSFIVVAYLGDPAQVFACNTSLAGWDGF